MIHWATVPDENCYLLEREYVNTYKVIFKRTIYADSCTFHLMRVVELPIYIPLVAGLQLRIDGEKLEVSSVEYSLDDKKDGAEIPTTAILHGGELGSSEALDYHRQNGWLSSD